MPGKVAMPSTGRARRVPRSVAPALPEVGSRAIAMLSVAVVTIRPRASLSAICTDPRLTPAVTLAGGRTM